VAGFVDEAQIHAKAGDGGAGAVSFRREAHVERGGPDGGDGGRGGDVWLVADVNQASLLGFRDHPHRRATDGTHGSGKRKHGASAPDLLVPVPVGTVVRERDGAVLCDLAGPGDRWLAAEGGRGGRGNARFLSNSRRAPAFAEQGERGQERWLDIELKLAADVALVGFPNAGKSTLISSVSAAKPKIADYPFTTLQPHLGVVRVGGRAGRDEVELVMADIPGLVEGAAEGRGLGHRFLRHIERSRVLVVLLDLAAADGTPPQRQLEVLLGELERYRPELLDRPRLVVGSKADVVGVAGEADVGGVGEGEGAGGSPGVDLVISSVTGQGLPELLYRLADIVTAARAAEAAAAVQTEIVIHRPAAEGVEIVRLEPGAWRIAGRAAERAVSFSDLTNDGALDEAVKRLRRMGVDRSLARAGARDGDEVHVGNVAFTWYREQGDGVIDRPAGTEERPPPRPRRRAGR
jgi:GTP-binding protein